MLTFGEDIGHYSGQKRMLGILNFVSFKSYDYFSEENACFTNSQSLTGCQNKPGSNQNFQTPFFRKRCQEDIAMLIASSHSNPARNELD